jgi:hypothetical protein
MLEPKNKTESYKLAFLENNIYLHELVLQVLRQWFDQHFQVLVQ